jgi:hypothetical protein
MVLKVAVTGTTEGKSGTAVDILDCSIRNNDEDRAVFTKTCFCAALSREMVDGSTELNLYLASIAQMSGPPRTKVGKYFMFSSVTFQPLISSNKNVSF